MARIITEQYLDKNGVRDVETDLEKITSIQELLEIFESQEPEQKEDHEKVRAEILERVGEWRRD